MLTILLKPFFLLLPALIPSWRFFDVIAPSPRIQYHLVNTDKNKEAGWTPFRPRPQQLGFLTMLKRMAWNPSWNEDLFLVSCAERLLEQPNLHSENEILRRIANSLIQQHPEPGSLHSMQFQFRLVLIQRIEDNLHEEAVFTSGVHSIGETEA